MIDKRENELKHARDLLAVFGTWAASAAMPPTVSEWNALVRERDAAKEAIAQVRKLHRDDYFEPPECEECSVPYPCATLRALDDYGSGDPELADEMTADVVGRLERDEQ